MWQEPINKQTIHNLSFFLNLGCEGEIFILYTKCLCGIKRLEKGYFYDFGCRK